MKAALAHVPVPRPGETFSSILLRLARNHAASAHELCAMLWPGFQFWTRDIDRTASDELLEAVKVCSLGQISSALYEVGGQYRRSM